MAAITKAFVKFDNKFWGDHKEWNIINDKRGYYPNWVVWDEEKLILLLIFYGDYSKRAEKLPVEEFKDELQDLLMKGFKGQANPALYRPTDIMFEKWTENPNFCGSWSSFPAGALPTDKDWDDYSCAVTTGPDGRKGQPCIYFGGEGFSKEYHVFLHGAYLRGEECAK